MDGHLSEFGRWHRVASEVIHKVADDEDPSCLEEAMASAVATLKNARNDYQVTLAAGLIRTVVDMRLLSILRGQIESYDFTKFPTGPGTQASGDPGV